MIKRKWGLVQEGFEPVQLVLDPLDLGQLCFQLIYLMKRYE